jgi:hypothetical protein
VIAASSEDFHHELWWHPPSDRSAHVWVHEHTVFLCWRRELDESFLPVFGRGQPDRRVEAPGFGVYAGPSLATGTGGIKWFNYNHAISFPVWAPLVIGCVLPAISGYRWRRQRRRRLRGWCLACGYDLRASAGRCPECGTRASGRA